MRAESWPEFKIKTASSDGDSKSALADIPKLFMLAKAISDIQFAPVVGVLLSGW
jgi:hypothetical protein